MTNAPDWLPALVKLDDYGGDWPKYLEAIYGVFKRDFIDFKPTYPGRRMGLKRHPLVDGKEATFWHFISEGSVEADRLPDLRRCERIGWPRPIIEAVGTNRVRCWQNTRKQEKRIVIALDAFSYVVILADRGEYVLPWTAFCVERTQGRKELEREYAKYEATRKS